MLALGDWRIERRCLFGRSRRRIAVGHFADKIGAIHPVMDLRRSEGILIAGATDVADGVPGAIVRPDRKGVIADAVSDIAAGAPAITETQHHRLRGLT